MANIRKMPIGVQDFEDLIINNYIYVDKTKFVYKLANEGKVYFLSRPRRFGKSLILSTLKQYFLGNKDIFKGLAIEKLEEENPTASDGTAWAKHPVIYIDLNSKKYENKMSLKEILDYQITSYEKMYSTAKKEQSLDIRFASLIRDAYQKTGRKVVLLVDEYDKPLLQVLGNKELFDDYRATLKSFYGVIKSEDANLRFSMLTGVTKFSQVSVWSDLNNLEDISMDDDFSGVCGITKNELHDNFNEEVQTLAKYNNMSVEECYAVLKKNYDGYHFSKNSDGVYNPFSLLNCFKKRDIGNYWFQTGTPTFLVEEIKRNNFDLRKIIDGVDADANSISEYKVGGSDPIPILVQSGYLTIKGYNREYNMYHLELPNEEVKYGFLKFLSPDFMGIDDPNMAFSIRQFNEDMKAGDVEAFMTRLQSIIASLPYPAADDSKRQQMLEYNFQVAVYLVFTLMGQFTQCEVHSIKGRADAVVETADTVYLFEFKTNETAQSALDQIEQNGYADKYKPSGKNIVKIGATFSTEKREMTEWMVV